MVKYKITIRLPNSQVLTFNVNYYEMLEGGLIRFTDEKFNKIKIYDSRLCEIEEVQE